MKKKCTTKSGKVAYKKYSTSEIGKVIERDHVSVINSYRKVKNDMDEIMNNLLEQEIAPKYPQYKDLGNYSTCPHEGVGYDNQLRFVHNDGTVSNGYTTGHWGKSTSDIRISAGHLVDKTDFLATAGHEIIHAYHYAYLGLTSWKTTSAQIKMWSEYSAYDWSCRVYSQAGMYDKALQKFYSSGAYPFLFRTPLHFW
jgi:hypothetical protein